MDEQNNCFLLPHIPSLIPLINGPVIADLLYYRKVLSTSDYHLVKRDVERETSRISERLLRWLSGKGIEELVAFKEVLMEIKNSTARDFILKCESENNLSPCKLEIAMKHLLLEPQNTNSTNDSGDGGPKIFYPFDHDGTVTSGVEAQNNQTEAIKEERNVKISIEFKSGPDIYKMSSMPRGFCVIINIINFQNVQHGNRTSAINDGEYLTKIFRQLGFYVYYYCNLTSKQIKKVFEAHSQDERLENHDCFVSVIMTHGSAKDLIMGSDSNSVKVDELLAFFNNFNCRFLRQRPKLFFIQACRGENYDYGVDDPGTTADAAAIPEFHISNSSNKTIPTWSDMCIVYSSLQGYVSLRNKNTGSWFTDALGRSLIEHACDYELDKILKEVNRLMLQREGYGRSKQGIEVILRIWCKDFYFNPGFYS